jgi:DNA-binding transcriptional regulator LsrR (DeoR family)
MLQVSRASAQRLVSLCLAERLITFRLEHPIAACMELAARLKDLFHLVYCEVVPTDPAAPLSGRRNCRARRERLGIHAAQ